MKGRWGSDSGCQFWLCCAKLPATPALHALRCNQRHCHPPLPLAACSQHCTQKLVCGAENAGGDEGPPGGRAATCPQPTAHTPLLQGADTADTATRPAPPPMSPICCSATHPCEASMKTEKRKGYAPEGVDQGRGCSLESEGCAGRPCGASPTLAVCTWEMRAQGSRCHMSSGPTRTPSAARVRPSSAQI